ncbi:STAS domain-containing protein [Marinobacterium sp. AK62]|uniref:STAS domain-containing protein n=1 Tax=Marinobacterium alkalitolerans TaxID=1542925 RepID=A0ABS3ZCK7_9GAMM|nr:STAS domain-containing protein [Marinobacterium alkalitolerans]MBP0049432.1 STAS domain-containing protein [Marinobacterium alkalitolerans]
MTDTRFELPEALVIQNIAEWKARFSEQLANGPLPPLEGSQLRDIDTAGLQLLLALVIEADKQGSAVRWASVSAELNEYAQSLGVTEHLKLAPA